jgi:hypothetical protein
VSKPCYAVLDSHSDLVAMRGNVNDALDIARAMPGDGDVVLDYTPASEPNPTEPIGGKRPLHEYPRRALERSGLRPVSAGEVMALSLEEAHERLAPFFPTSKSPTEQLGQAYATPAEMKGNLLGQNYKMEKTGEAIGGDLTVKPDVPINVRGLSLLPHSLGSQSPPPRYDPASYGVKLAVVPGNRTVCLWSTGECQAACLVASGHNNTDKYYYVTKYSRTQALLAEPVAFVRMLHAAIRFHFFPPRGSDALRAVRLNVYSDLPWEIIAPWLFEDFAGQQFYDYTKVPGRKPPPNYDLTFSYSGTPSNLEHVDHEVSVNNRRVAVVFVLVREGGRLVKPPPGLAQLPREFMGLPLVDGDTHDYRPLDPPNRLYGGSCVVALRYKAPILTGFTPEHHDLKSFVVPVHEHEGVYTAAVVPRQYGTEPD